MKQTTETIKATEYIKGMLLPHQADALDAIDWFLYGGRGEGKTFLACNLAILRALEYPSQPIEVFDHHYAFRPQDYVLDLLYSIISHNPFLEISDFKFNITRRTITYMGYSRVYRKETEDEGNN